LVLLGAVTRAVGADTIGPPVPLLSVAASSTTIVSPTSLPVTYSYSYQWEDCGSSGANCAAIPGATSQT
jgi:hypothetical protein